MAFQRTDPAHEQFASRHSSKSSDSDMMDEILALLLQDQSSSDDEQKYSEKDDGTTKDCGVPGQHCGSEQSESPEEKALPPSPPFSATPASGERHPISDIISIMNRPPSSPMRLDFASVFRDKPLDLPPSSTELGTGSSASKQAASPSKDGRKSKKSIAELDDAEFEHLKKRVRTQEASRRYRRRKKETLRLQKQEIQELRDELTRLHSIEADIKAMDQQSPSTVVREFDAQAQELHEKLDETRAAAESELALIRSIQDQLLGRPP